MKKTALIFASIALLVLAILAGYFFGTRKGAEEGATVAEEKYAPIVDLIYPKPADTITKVSGFVRGIYGATITLEVNDPEDYLPHLDGSPKKTVTRFVTVGAATKMTLIDDTKRDANGNSTVGILKLSDLKEGDAISVTSADNIRTSEQVDATEIRLVKYPS